MIFLDCPLDNLDLLRDSRKLFFKETVELIEASPRAALYQTDEDSTHRLEVNALITIEHQHLTAKRLAEGFDRLSLSCACWSVRITSVTELHTEDERQIALVCQGRVCQLARIALVLVSIVEKCIAHAYHALVVLSFDFVP